MAVSTPVLISMESFLTAFAMDLGMCRIGIKGMTCGACVATIENYIPNAVDGVISISVGLLAERAEVIYDKCTTEPKQIAAAIEDVGFQAQVLLEVRRCLPFLCGGGTLLITDGMETLYSQQPAKPDCE